MNFLNEKSIRELNSIKSYTEFLNQFPVIRNPSRSIEIGQLYSCDEYDFSLDYPQEILNTFDRKPLQLVFNKNATHYWAISIHNLPVLYRAAFLKRVMNANPLRFHKKMERVKIRISYLTIKSISQKYGTIACRQYRFDRVNNLRKIPLEYWSEASQYSPNTFHNSSLEKILQKNR